MEAPTAPQPRGVPHAASGRAFMGIHPSNPATRHDRSRDSTVATHDFAGRRVNWYSEIKAF